MRIVQLDPHDEAALRAYHATYLAADTFERAYPTPWLLEEVRAELKDEGTGSRTVAFSGIVGGEVVSAANIALSLKDNLKMVEAMVYTHPDRRRRGYGSKLLDHVERYAAAQGRSLVNTFVDFPYEAPADGVGQPNVEFLLARGYAFGVGNVQRALDLPVPANLLDRLIAEAAEHHPGYELREFHTRTPEELAERLGRLVGILVTEAPMGDIEIEEQHFDVQRMRDDEKLMAESGRTPYTTVAIAPDGQVAAYTMMVVPSHDPGRVYQWGTLVHPEHRGRRLGLAVKARNHRFLQQHEHGVDSVSTYNAEVNTHMIAVNEKLGYRPVGRGAELQKRLS